jgi:carbon-monoxide dehydrogenase iron sulfur subunit
MKRIMIDAEKCDGCKNCSIACMEAHRENRGGGLYTVSLGDPATESRNIIALGSGGKYTPIFCRHCDEPECVLACMSGAMSRDANTGHIMYDEERCAACFMCVMNCPYGVLKPDRATRSKVVKCDFCAGDDEEPNCVNSCPKKAIFIEEVV